MHNEKFTIQDTNVFLNGQRDKKGQKLTKNKSQSSEDDGSVTFWSLPRQRSLCTTAACGQGAGSAMLARLPAVGPLAAVCEWLPH